MTSNGRLDLLLAHPGNRPRIYHQLGEDLSDIEPPVWAVMMSRQTLD